jgi:hypothetical protein
VFALSATTTTPVAVWVVLKHLRRSREAHAAMDEANDSMGGIGSKSNTKEQGTSLGGDYGMGTRGGTRGCFSNSHSRAAQINSRLDADPEAAPLVLASRRETQGDSYV